MKSCLVFIALRAGRTPSNLNPTPSTRLQYNYKPIPDSTSIQKRNIESSTSHTEMMMPCTNGFGRNETNGAALEAPQRTLQRVKSFDHKLSFIAIFVLNKRQSIFYEILSSSFIWSRELC